MKSAFCQQKKTTLENGKNIASNEISGSVIEAIVERKHELLVEFTSSDLQKEGNVKLQEERCDSKELVFSRYSAGFHRSPRRNSLEGLHELRST